MYCIHKDQHRFLYVTGLSTTTIMDKSLGTLMHFWLIFQFTQVQPLYSPHKQCWTCVSRMFSELQLCSRACTRVKHLQKWLTNQNLSTDQMSGGIEGLTIWLLRGLWVISEKVSCRLISRGKKHANKFLGEKYPALKKLSLMTYNAEKKLYREKNSNFREVWEKVLPIQTKSVKSPIPHSLTNVQWSCQPFRRWWKKWI